LSEKDLRMDDPLGLLCDAQPIDLAVLDGLLK
jgi:hypothetical protein